MIKSINEIKIEEICFACGVLNVVKAQAESDNLSNLVSTMQAALDVLGAELEIRRWRQPRNEFDRISKKTAADY